MKPLPSPSFDSNPVEADAHPGVMRAAPERADRRPFIRRAAFVGTSLASAVLAACGGGGGGSGTTTASGAGSGTTTVGGAASTPSDPVAVAEAAATAAAARFLLRAQFSASDSDIAAVRSQGEAGWLAAQFAAPATTAGWDWINGRPRGALTIDDMLWNQLMSSSDAVRKRVALALSEIFVVSATVITYWPDLMYAAYWDILNAGASGNFRTLLENVTLSPAMGYYLNSAGSQKENAAGRMPDENYAREVMQLMTIGLYQLEQDGSVKKGADGLPLYTYTQDDVVNLARVFTGYNVDILASERGTFNIPGSSTMIESNAWTRRPMALTASNHSMLAATFLGTTVPANTEGKAALGMALDALFNHPNVGPFIGRQLIQRLVTSNPSPAYIARVARAFASNSAGVRGDMPSVVMAVLLDPEARGTEGLADPKFGKLREPMLRFVQWGRTFRVDSKLGTWKIGSTANDTSLGQSPLRSPSVFNFFRPGYVPPSTAMAGTGQVAPEFQLVNESSVSGYLNFIQRAIGTGFNNRDVVADYTPELALVLDPVALVARLNLLLTANQLSASTCDLIATALGTPALTTASSDAAKNNRVYAAILLVMASAEYIVQK
ncbi:DUF1800 domain-containing protein [Variovorax ginsengisoli]|uniref:Uncharacterized protein (DUF1800 family) n=1 Tax=Variovorax ginsengisoli TaxID=363844 RepID=A0ABT9SD91_9BURK|nr:DUF1800 domain-containing protein [Variovorax ginsengisoli]MDP9902325.1 uncharacterized protein (DUF1800 family) [Variovorax ginsengisoli]